MKKIIKIIFFLFMIIMSVCITKSFAEDNNTKSLSSISVTTEPQKKEYKEGEKFDSTGMIITARYSDGSTKEVNDYHYFPNGKLSCNNKEIEISYEENGITKSTSQKITVKTSLEEIVLNFKDVTLSTKSNLTWNLIVVANPTGATIPELTWTSSDEKIVKIIKREINTSVTLQPVSNGKATINVKSSDGKYSAICNVTVTDGIETVDTSEENIVKNSANDDTTVKKSELPKTGITISFLIIISMAIVIAWVSYLKYKKYKGIK